jgi:hypothetical protein
MAKKTTEEVIAELTAAGITIPENASYKELTALLPVKEEVKEEKPVKKAKEVNQVPLGVATINDHEARISALEDILMNQD